MSNIIGENIVLVAILIALSLISSVTLISITDLLHLASAYVKEGAIRGQTHLTITNLHVDPSNGIVHLFLLNDGTEEVENENLRKALIFFGRPGSTTRVTEFNLTLVSDEDGDGNLDRGDLAEITFSRSGLTSGFYEVNVEVNGVKASALVREV